VNASLAHLSVCVPWSEDVSFLLQMPGIGLVSAMTILSAIGDIARFPTAKQLVGYAGLVMARVPVPVGSRDAAECCLLSHG
jgi:uncharacterized membrane protein